MFLLNKIRPLLNGRLMMNGNGGMRLKKTSLEHMEKLIKKGGLSDLKKISLKLYLGKKPQKRLHLMMKALSGIY
jgi:hypothetical protein